MKTQPGTDDLGMKVVMMGPSRVGKTTLLTAVLSETRERLAGTPVSFDPADNRTRAMVKKNAAELQSELHSGEFTGAGLQSTQDVTRYSFRLSTGVDEDGISVDFMDFPGSLLNDTQAHRRTDWQEVQKFADDSIAMLVPIDATVVMEAVQPAHKREWTHLLDLQSVEDAVRQWAKKRKARPDDPAILLLAPVKCETYFSDNGGSTDRSAELRKEVINLYSAITRAAQRECDHVMIYYSPVDSIGCVEVERVVWKTEARGAKRGDSPRLVPAVRFFVRSSTRRSTVGAETVILLLVREIVKNMSATARREALESSSARDAAVATRDQRRAFSTRVTEWFSGKQRERVITTQLRADEAEAAAERKANYEKVVKKLARAPFSQRSSRVEKQI